MPMVSARVGTASTAPPKHVALAARVSGCKVATWVGPHNTGPGSLKPMWPLAPRPHTSRSNPPADAIAWS
jgi:hypothetical protein